MRLKPILLIALVLTSVFIVAALGIIASVLQANYTYPNAISTAICDPTSSSLSNANYRAVHYHVLSYSCRLSPDSPDQVMDWYQHKGWERTPALGRPYQSIGY